MKNCSQVKVSHVNYQSSRSFSFKDMANVKDCSMQTCMSKVSKLKCAINNIYFTYFSTKTYVVGTQKNHLTEMAF